MDDSWKPYISLEEQQKLLNCVREQLNRTNVLLLVRGLPGSGKSSIGKAIADELHGLKYESDDNFMVEGEYRYDPTLLTASHEATQSACRLAMAHGTPVVVASMTFTRYWEYETYLLAASSYNYTTIIFDLHKHITERLDTHTLDEYIQFLSTSNQHDVPLAKLQEMARRYEFGESELTILQSEELNKKRRCGHEYKLFDVLDTGYYLALDIKTADRDSRQHSLIFKACIAACQHLMETLDAGSVSRMVKRTIARNLKSHSRTCGGKTAAVAGWARLHVTLLNPGEYQAIKEAGRLDGLKEEIEGLYLDALAQPFAVDDAVIQHIGLVQGAIQAADSSGAAPPQAVTLSEELGKLLGLHQSSAFYLLLPQCEVLDSIRALRQKYLGPEGSDNHWQPHITLGFTHNDIHSIDRVDGLRAFQALLTDFRSRNGTVLPFIDLTPDTGKSAAELVLHSETACTVSQALGFDILDFKVRKGPFGDDMTYKTHPILLQLLPRGLVFLQPVQRSMEGIRTIYEGIWSLRKFFGKDGMEDDGSGLSAGELNLRLHEILGKAEVMLLMEKVNGRAASCRFFNYHDNLYVIIGTKLAHTVARVDTANRRLQLSEDYNEALSAANSQVKSEEVADLPNGVLEDGEEERVADILQDGNFRNALIVSNTRALERSLQWENVHDLASWLHGRTMNGEVLDPEEMHLVALQELQWVHLCLTEFPSSSVNDVRKGLLEERSEAEKFLKFLPSISELDLRELQGMSRRETVIERARTVVHCNDTSEGQVLYFLDAQGMVLEMIKYKTWWYVYRRSIRQLAAKLLSRHFKIARSRSEEAALSSRQQKLEAQLCRLNKVVEGMQRAKNKENDMAFQSKLKDAQREVAELEIMLNRRQSEEMENSRSQKVAQLNALTEELQNEVQRRWPTKFSFLRDDLGSELYLRLSSEAMQQAVGFLQFLVEELLREEAKTLRRFKRYFPLLWEDFHAKWSTSKSPSTEDMSS